MSLALLQIALTAAACLAMWRLWSFLRSGDRVLATIAGAGFLVRAFAAQALFWISWLRLPIWRSLQTGDGFWFFALDGPGYFRFANEALHRGPQAVVFLGATYPSHVFVQVLAVFVAAFGNVASVAILLNCAAYLSACAILVHLGTRAGRVNLPTVVALAAVAFGPGTILWSLQPLKDTLFLLLVVATIDACFVWQELWRTESAATAWWRLAACAAAILALGFAIAGIRWYVAAIIWAACSIFCFLTALQARRRSFALVANAALFVLLAQSIRLGGDADYVDPLVARMLAPRPKIAASRPLAGLTSMIGYTRSGFENTPGATTIAAGPAVVQEKASAPAAPPPSPSTSPPGGEKVAVGPVSGAAPVSEPVAEPVAAPQTFADRMIVGLAATFLPRAAAQGLGLIRIGGGRGLWLFAEHDTIVFDLVVLFAVVYCARMLITSRARLTPLFVLVVLIFVLIAGPLIYTVSNFGTLFRLRQMLYVIAAIIPMTLAPKEVTGGW